MDNTINANFSPMDTAASNNNQAVTNFEDLQTTLFDEPQNDSASNSDTVSIDTGNNNYPAGLLAKDRQAYDNMLSCIQNLGYDVSNIELTGTYNEHRSGDIVSSYGSYNFQISRDDKSSVTASLRIQDGATILAAVSIQQSDEDNDSYIYSKTIAEIDNQGNIVEINSPETDTFYGYQDGQVSSISQQGNSKYFENGVLNQLSDGNNYFNVREYSSFYTDENGAEIECVTVSIIPEDKSDCVSCINLIMTKNDFQSGFKTPNPPSLGGNAANPMAFSGNISSFDVITSDDSYDEEMLSNSPAYQICRNLGFISNTQNNFSVQSTTDAADGMPAGDMPAMPEGENPFFF